MGWGAEWATWDIQGSSVAFKGKIKVGASRRLWVGKVSDNYIVLGDESTVEVLTGGGLFGHGKVGKVESSGGVIEPEAKAVSLSGGAYLKTAVLKMKSLHLKGTSCLYFDLYDPYSSDKDLLEVDGKLQVDSDAQVKIRLTSLDQGMQYSAQNSVKYDLIKYNTSDDDKDALIPRFVVMDCDKNAPPLDATFDVKTGGSSKVLFVKLKASNYNANAKHSYWYGSGGLVDVQGASGFWMPEAYRSWSPEDKSEVRNYKADADVLTFGEITSLTPIDEEGVLSFDVY